MGFHSFFFLYSLRRNPRAKQSPLVYTHFGLDKQFAIALGTRFLAGYCSQPEIAASSRIFRYIWAVLPPAKLPLSYAQAKPIQLETVKRNTLTMGHRLNREAIFKFFLMPIHHLQPSLFNSIHFKSQFSKCIFYRCRRVARNNDRK